MTAREKWCFVAILVLGQALRLPGLSDSFYGDEGFSLLRDSQEIYTHSEDRFRPVFFSLLYLWRQLGFSGEIGLRLLPLLFGVAQIPLLFVLGRKVRDVRTGLWSAALVASSPMLIEFSQELRMYSLAACIGLAQAWFYWQLRSAFSWFRWMLFVLAGVLGVYTHLHYWLFLAGFALLALWERKLVRWQAVLGALGVVFALYVPNYQNVINFSIQRGGEYVMHLPSALPKLGAAFLVGYNYFSLPEQGLGRQIGFEVLWQNAVLAVLAVVPMAFLFVGWMRRRNVESDRETQRLVLTLGLFPILLALTAALVTHKNWLQPKYLISSVPFVMLAIPCAWQGINVRWQQASTLALGICVLGISWLHLNDDRNYGRREDWRAAAAYLREHLPDNGKLLITQGTWWLLDYYGGDTRKDWVGDNTELTGRFASEEYANRLRAALSDATRVYYLRVDTFQNMWDPQDELPKTLDRLGERGQTVQLNPRLTIMQWRLGSQ